MSKHNIQSVKNHLGYKFLEEILDRANPNFQAEYHKTQADGIAYIDLDAAWIKVGGGQADSWVQALTELCTSIGCMGDIRNFYYNMPREWISDNTRELYRLQRRSGFLAIVVSAVSHQDNEPSRWKRLISWLTSIFSNKEKADILGLVK